MFLSLIYLSSWCYKIVLFADDTNLFVSDKSLHGVAVKANEQLNKIENWLHANKLQINIITAESDVIGWKIGHQL